MKACKRSLEDILASVDQSGHLEDALLLLCTFKTVGFHLDMGLQRMPLPQYVYNINFYPSLYTSTNIRT